MSWTAPINWTTGLTVNATHFNEQIKTNIGVARKQLIQLSYPGSLTSGVKALGWIAPFKVVINDVNAVVNTPSTSGSIVVDVRYSTKNSSTHATIFAGTSAALTITSGNYAATALTPSVTTVAQFTFITLAPTTSLGSTSVADVDVILSVSGA